MHKSAKPVGTKPDIMHENYKVHKKQIDGGPLFQPILSAYRILHITLLSF